MVSQCVHWPDARRVGWASDVKIVHTANGDLCPRIPVGVYYVVVVQLRAEWQKKHKTKMRFRYFVVVQSYSRSFVAGSYLVQVAFCNALINGMLFTTKRYKFIFIHFTGPRRGSARTLHLCFR